jgi:hypothetical protein
MLTILKEPQLATLIVLQRMASSGMLRGVALLTRATRRNIPEDAILHSHRRENLKSSVCSSVCVRIGAFAIVVMSPYKGHQRDTVHENHH